MRAISNAGDLVYRNRDIVFTRHDQLAKVFRPLHACVDFYHTLLCQRADAANWQVLVFAFNGIDHLLSGDPKGLERLRVQVNIDLTLGAAHNRDRTCAAHVFQALFQYLIRPVRQLCGRHGRITCNRQDGNRPDSPAGRIKPQNARLFYFSPEAGPDGRYFFAHIFGSLAAIDIQLKLNDDH